MGKSIRKDQRFLRDRRALERIVAWAEPCPSDAVLEVGSGPGNLTALLAARGCRVVTIEKDRSLAARVRALGLPGVEVVEGDALKVPWPPFDLFVSNVPYSISTPLLFRLLDHPFRRAVVTLQREVAERIAARPGTREYGRLTVSVQRRASVRILGILPPSAFEPRPRVASAVVLIEPRGLLPPDDAWFQEVLRALFSRRRKRISTVLRDVWGVEDPVARGDERPETLSPEELADLAREIRRRLGPVSPTSGESSSLATRSRTQDRS